MVDIAIHKIVGQREKLTFVSQLVKDNIERTFTKTVIFYSFIVIKKNRNKKGYLN